jgi:hypothetical protein
MSGIVGQNTLDGSGLIKSPEGGGAWNFIKKLTASASSDLSFVDGTDDVVLDSTYKTYFFTFNNMHPETDHADFQFNMSIDTGSNYNVAKTSIRISAYHKENDSGTPSVVYHASSDLAQGTGAQFLFQNIGNDSDQCASGYLYLFEPSSTTFVKHFISRGQLAEGTEYSEENYTAGYGNTTSAVDAIQFSMSTGNIDAGDICLYGISS